MASTRTAAAKAAGVVAVYTGKDMEADGIGGLPCGWQIHSKDGSPMQEPPHPVLASGQVRHVGDPVAVVIAESLAQARDAAELVNVDYAVEPAVADVAEALKPGAPLVHAEVPGNICYDWHLGDPAAVDAALVKARRASSSSTSSTTGWCRTRWSRAPRSAISTARPASTRSSRPARTRM